MPDKSGIKFKVTVKSFRLSIFRITRPYLLHLPHRSVNARINQTIHVIHIQAVISCSEPFKNKMEISSYSAGKSAPYPNPPNLLLTQFPAWPMADPALAQEILDLLQQAHHSHQLKRGANEGIYSKRVLSILLRLTFPQSPRASTEACPK